MSYPVVRHSHVLPRSYLSNFAANGMIAMRLLGEQASKEVSTRDAGVRQASYRRTRPDGTPIHDVEWSLSSLESEAAPLLRTIGTSWPLGDDKRILAELFAYQVVRGPRWKVWHEQFTRDFVEGH